MPEQPLLAFDDGATLALEHEEVLLVVGLLVVERARLAGLQHVEPDAELREGERLEPFPRACDRASELEEAREAEGRVTSPRGVACVQDEPPVGHRRETGHNVFEARLVGHGSHATVQV